MEQTNFMQTVPDSHYWTNIEMLITFLQYQQGQRKKLADYLITGLRNTLNNGYDIKPIEPKT